MNEYVLIPDNPAPESIEIFYFRDDQNRQMRGMFAHASSKYASPRGTIIISPGRTEFIEKYFELARDMQERGFCVVAFDWPGQGLSYRMLKDPLAGHIDDFNTYIQAFRRGLNAIDHKLYGARVVLAHSMGGAIALEAIRQQVLDVEAAAFCAPMWGLKIAKILHPLVPIMCKIGRSEKLVHKHDLDEKFEGNIITNYEKRWKVQQDLIKANSKLALGAITWGWVNEALKVSKTLAQPKALDHINIPILIASALEEALVDNHSHALLASRLKSAQHIKVAGAKHEILMETDSRRDQFMTAFDKMLDRAGI
ncbi:alpha/beta fold hydrolase [Hirschia baltica]|uniref:Alpha/beta hydrolase fold protein n=1 Tax=Hirschia baltica (strain ATCC 49814 / DSM 5838 / IFAM 1418) TaxID=582402 RepID=C6XRP8_HIRBI|nr:alpha/beta hydrolase [Hirschia baltica]ACT60658.1 alpha/beta hydrolase fold protein [Hirschia baltica ATCC 49814]